MTEQQFRRIALSFEGAVESAHMGHPDFRMNGRIFATLGGSGKGRGMVKVPPEQQHNFVLGHPEVFQPANGAWGRQGSTTVELAAAQRDIVRAAMEIAWRWASATPPSKSRPRKRK